MIEYAITQGEGTLLAYGVAEFIDFDGISACIEFLDDDGFYDMETFTDDNMTIIARPCTSDCETGK
jgi:hypothetical protein